MERERGSGREDWGLYLHGARRMPSWSRDVPCKMSARHLAGRRAAERRGVASDHDQRDMGGPGTVDVEAWSAAATPRATRLFAGTRTRLFVERVDVDVSRRRRGPSERGRHRTRRSRLLPASSTCVWESWICRWRAQTRCRPTIGGLVHVCVARRLASPASADVAPRVELADVGTYLCLLALYILPLDRGRICASTQARGIAGRQSVHRAGSR